MKPDWNFFCIHFININLKMFIYKIFTNISDHEDTLSMKGQPCSYGIVYNAIQHAGQAHEEIFTYGFCSQFDWIEGGMAMR